MSRNFEHSTIIDKEIGPFGTSPDDSIQLFFGKPTFGPPCTVV